MTDEERRAAEMRSIMRMTEGALKDEKAEEKKPAKKSAKKEKK